MEEKYRDWEVLGFNSAAHQAAVVEETAKQIKLGIAANARKKKKNGM